MENLLLPIHIGTLFITAVFILIADHDAFLYMRGKKELLSRKKVKIIHYTVWTGLIIMITTGLTMAYSALGDLIKSTGFLTKMFFVILLFINAIAIHFLSDLAIEKPFVSLSKKEKTLLLISGAASTIGWLGAAITAYIIFG
ncbi:MAG: hypothetical protein AAB513_02530 [Patescibacteria group bacterium]